MDACLAMNATLAVTYPHMCGVGGDLFLLHFEAASGQVAALNGSGRAPMLASPAEYKRRGLNSVPARGPLSTTVPGVVDAWERALDRFGTMTLQELLAPAIASATAGMEIGERLAGWIAQNQKELASDAYLRQTFLAKDATPLKAGDSVALPTLATTLQRISEGGSDEFYRGQLASEIENAVRRAGGLLSRQDLAETQSEWVEPVRARLDEYDLYTTPPNSQGFVALQMLQLLNEWQSTSYELDSSDYIDDVVRAKRLAFADRARFLGDPRFTDVPVGRLLSSNHIRRLATHTPAHDQVSILRGDTVYACAIDADGNACSLIQSIYYAFGSAFSIDGTGIVLHNRAHYFSLDPASVNCIAGGKRPAHTLMASIALLKGRPAFVVGTMGADGQPQTVTQVAARLLAGEHPQDAVSAPRFLSGRFLLEDPDDSLLMESDFSVETCADLRERGHLVEIVPSLDERMGHAHAIAVQSDGFLVAGADPRSDGTGLVVELKRPAGI